MAQAALKAAAFGIHRSLLQDAWWAWAYYLQHRHHHTVGAQNRCILSLHIPDIALCLHH